MITDSDRLIIQKRDKQSCQHPMCPFRLNIRSQDNLLEIKLDLHHVHFKSLYRGVDRDQPWNLVTLHHYCHLSEIGPHQNKSVNSYFRGIANSRKLTDRREGGHHPDILRARKKKQNTYQKRLARFRQRNNGLSPSQVAYKRKKEWLKKQQEIKTEQSNPIQ